MIYLLSGILQCRLNVFPLKVRKTFQNIPLARAAGEHLQNIFHANAHAANTGSAPALVGIEGNSIQVTHRASLSDLLQLGEPRFSQAAHRNRTKRTGYKVVRVPFDKSTGKARGEYEDFVTGFVTPDGKVWGRPVGITVAKDGSLLISEDGDKTIWRVSYGR